MISILHVGQEHSSDSQKNTTFHCFSIPGLLMLTLSRFSERRGSARMEERVLVQKAESCTASLEAAKRLQNL